MKKKFLAVPALVAAIALGCLTATGCNLIVRNDQDSGDNGGHAGDGGGSVIAVSGVNVNPVALTLEAGGTYALTANVSPDDATDKSVSWSSGNEAVATVSDDGAVTALSAGSAEIIVTTTDGGYTDRCAVTVEERAPQVVKVDGVTVAHATLTLETGGTYALTANVSPSDATDKSVSWSSGNGSVATVSDDGVVTALSAGSAEIIVTTTDGGYTDRCAVTVEERAPQVVKADGVTVAHATLTLEIGGTYALTANVSPDDATDKSVSWSSGNEAVATVSDDGVVTALSAGSAEIIVTTTDGGYTGKCTVTVKAADTNLLTLTYSYGGNECAAFEWEDGNPSAATVRYKRATETNYTQLDAELIRAVSAGTARADIVGLKGGENYEFSITSSSGRSATVTKTVTAYDRSGYAHFNFSGGVGAYNDDGTPKENAQIIYVSEATKNTVKATIGSKTYTGICAILGGLSNSKTPVIVRVIGTVGAATWNKIDYNSDKTYNSQNKMPSSVVVGINGKQLPVKSNTYQKDLIDGGYNTLNTSVYSELIGLDSRAKYSDGEYDTIWNNCPIKNAENVTLEGIGEDARLFQWGLTWGSCNSIEVRNLTFEDYTEDACSFEGSKNSVTVDGFDSKRIWVHHNTFLEGMNYWDLCAEQDKHEGDGATDFKKLAYLTSSYNEHRYNHKTGLVGGSDDTTTACVTFHHNYYNRNSSRLPLGREANMHMYNNYYYGSTGTNMSLRAGAYALIENCCFENANNPIEIKPGNNPDKSAQITGAAKLFGNVFSGKTYEANGYIYEVTDRAQTVANDNIFNKNFDTDPTAFYYDAANGSTDVSVMYTAEETKSYVPLLAGVQKRGGRTYIAPSGGGSLSGGSGSGTASQIPTYSELSARDDVICSDDFDGYAGGYKFAELDGYGTAGVYSVPDAGQGYGCSYTQADGGKTAQVANAGVSDVSVNGKNTATAIAFGGAAGVVEGYFEMTVSEVGSKWDLIKFTDGTSSAFAVRIDADKTKPLTYTVDGGAAVTPSQSFVWKANVTYKVYFKIDYGAGRITVNITDGSGVFNVADTAFGGNIYGIHLQSGNKGQRLVSIDNLVICGGKR